MAQAARKVGTGYATGRPWGWKANVSIYVKGGAEDIEAVLDTLQQAVQSEDIHFAGIAVEQVEDAPEDQGGT